MPAFHLVDAFTARPFAGNPAGVVVLDAGPVDATWAQLVAAEVRASETAFVHPEGETWRLRWWTPTAEVALCGHATLATAHVLFTAGLADPDAPCRFATRSGELRTVRRPGEDGEMIAMDLPAWPLASQLEPPELPAALGGAPGRYLGRTDGDQPNHVAEVATADALDALEPDLDAVRALGATGLIVTAPGDGDVDLVSRYFAPNVGVDEDPVTGSAHATLGPLWAGRLGRRQLVADQRSARGGRLHLDVGDDRVEVAGQAVTVVEGRLLAAT